MAKTTNGTKAVESNAFMANLQKISAKPVAQGKSKLPTVDMNALFQMSLPGKSPGNEPAHAIREPSCTESADADRKEVQTESTEAVDVSLEMTETPAASFFQPTPDGSFDKSMRHNQNKPTESDSASEDIDKGVASLIARAMRMKKAMTEAAVASATEVTDKVRAKAELPTAISAISDNQNSFGAQFKAASENHGATSVIKPSGSTRVAAYIRVSSDSSDQENSYELQEKYFSELLAGQPNWISAGVYSDYGISGTAKDKRIGFLRLLRHCREGRIDRIVCKSISRFARNTEDFVTALQTLKQNRVTIAFEKENIDTAEPVGDFILTTLAAVAQEESRSISANIRWGIEKRYPKGDVRNYEIYGYRYNDKWITTESGYRYRDIDIVEEEAAIVRRIFKEVSEGEKFISIARRLNFEHVPTPQAKIMAANQKKNKKGWLNPGIDEGWTGPMISRIVRNERYVGDVLLQKSITLDHMTHKPKPNKGEAPQYLIQNHHKPIVARNLYDAAKKALEFNKSSGNHKGGQKGKAFTSRLICAHCGRFYNVHNGTQNPIWVCPSSKLNNGRAVCHAERIYEEQIVRMFRKAAIERFSLTTSVIEDNVTVDDIMSGRYQGPTDILSIDADGFVAQMEARIESIQRQDNMERDRAFLKRKIAAVQIGNDRIRKRIRLLQSQKNAMETRFHLLDDDAITEEMIAEKNARLSEETERLESGEAEEKTLTDRLTYLENYWEELEADHVERENALSWMKKLPKSKEGTREFLNGLTSDYVKAFVLSVTIYSPLKYTVHWFDDTRTDVEMYTNIENYHYTSSWIGRHR